MVVHIVANNVNSFEDRTLVKRESTSKDASKPVGRMVRTICKNSSVELIIYLAGRYSDMMVLNCFAMV